MVVHSVFCLQNLFIGDYRKIAAFWEEAAENSVEVLVCAMFAGGVWMGKIKFCPTLAVNAASFNSFDVYKLTSAVTGERGENLSECLTSDFFLNSIKNFDDAFSLCIWNLFYNLFTAFPFCHCKKTFCSFVNFQRIQFPMTESFACFDLFRMIIYAVLSTF